VEKFVNIYFSGNILLTAFSICEIISFMEFETFLQSTNQTINGFAKKHGVPSTTVWRAAKKKVLRPINARLISIATGGLVTTDELLYPFDNHTGKEQ
jgi:hypothetical protein